VKISFKSLRAALFLPLVGCGSGGRVFIAEQSNFADFLSWESFDNGLATPNTGHPLGEEWLFRNEKPSGGKYPVGAILMKEIQVMPELSTWQLFAMAKRGDNYNAGGATDWEFFTLALDTQMQPLILTSGENPVDPNSTISGYGTGVDGVTCNRCHGIAGTEATDHVLDDKLAP
jgi:hypothetical protein